MRLTSLGVAAILSFGFDLVQAQTPTQTWTPGAAVCSLGLPTPTSQNGTYIDKFQANWAVQCGQDSTGFWYDNLGGTLGQGVYACFKGCDSRPGCSAFAYIGTVTGATSGSGRCYYKFAAGTYYTNATVYAAANLISNGTPQLVCPYYNGTTFTASDGSVWQVLCGYDSTATPASTNSAAVGSMAQCMTQCNAISDCTLFTYTYTGAEPADGAANTDGTCYFKKGSPLQYAAPTVGFAQRIATAGAPIPTSSAVSSTAVLITSSAAVTSTPAATSTGALAVIGGVVSSPVAGVVSSSLVNVGSSSLVVVGSTTLISVASTSLAVVGSSSIVNVASTSLGIASTTLSVLSTTLAGVASTSLVNVGSTTLGAGSSSLLNLGSTTLTIVSLGTPVIVASSSLVNIGSTPVAIAISSTSINVASTSPVILPSTTLGAASSTALVNVASTQLVNVASTSLAALISTTVSIPTTSVSQAVSLASTTLNIAASPSASVLACTSNPVPSTPACPAANATTFLDTCGQNYTVYCGFDSTPGAVAQQPASSLLQCMQLCDNYSGCQSASYVPGSPGICYFKTAFTAITGSTNVVALVRNLPPNAAYPTPLSGTNVNASTGCGQALPGGLTANGPSVLFNFINPTDGLQRNYTVHIPQYYDPNKASPLIFAFPGNGENAGNIESETGLSNGAVNPYAIVAYVNGYGLGFASNPDWGVPGGRYSFVDDLGFMKNLIANMTSSFCIDTTKIWATGHSNGGGFVNVLACDPVLSGVFSAFVANSAAAYTNATTGDPSTIEPVNTPIQPLCSPSRLVPFLEIHGTADATIAYYGGSRRGRILPTIPHFITDWAIRNGLGASNITTALNSLTTQYQFGAGAGLGLVSQLTLAGWGHYWPTVAGGAPIDGAPIAMNFFYTWSNASRLASNLTSPASTTTVSATTLSNPFAFSLPSTTLGITLSNTTALTVPLTASVSATLATPTNSLNISGIPSAVSVSAGVSFTLGVTASFTPSILSTSFSTLPFTINGTSILSLPSTSLTISPPSVTLSVPTTSFSISPSFPTISISTPSPSLPTTSFTLSVPSTSISIAGPSLSSISFRSLSAPSFTTSFPSPSLSLFSTSVSIGSPSLPSSSLSLPTTSFSPSIPSFSVPSTSIGFSSLSFSTPSTSVQLPSTSISIASTFYSLFSTSLSFPSTFPAVPTTSISLFSTSIVVPTISTPSLSSAGVSSLNTGVSATLSSPSSTSATPLSTIPPSYTCPFNNGSIVNSQNGVTYIIQCGADTSGQNNGIVSASASFNDCFYNCDSTAGCLGFTYSGSSAGQGEGPGLCFLKSGPVGFTSGSASVVAVVRYTGPFTASYAPTIGGSTSLGVTASVSVSSLSISLTSSAASLSVQSTAPSLPGLGLPTFSTSLALSSISLSSPSAPSFSLTVSSAPGVTLPSTPINAGTVSSVSVSFPSVAISVGFDSTVISPPTISSIAVSTPSFSSLSAPTTSIPLPSTSATLPISSLPSTSLAGPSASFSVPLSSISIPVSLTFGASTTSSVVLAVTSTSSTSTDTGASSTSSTVAATSQALLSSLPVITASNPLTITSISASVVSTALPSTSIPPPCPTNVCGVAVAQQQNNQTCQDAFGNHFAVTCGVKVTGAVAVRLTKPDSNSCLQACDTTSVCVAANYDSSNGDCELLSTVTGTQPAAPQAAAARRPADVSTVYTGYPTTTYTTSSMMTGPAGYGSPVVTTTSSQAAPNSYAGPASSLAPIVSYIGMSSYSGSYPVLVPTSTPTLPGASSPSTSTRTSTSQSVPAVYGSMTTGAPSATTSSAQYTGPICPNYDGLFFTDAQANTYSVQCNSAYQGVQIPGSYKRARQAVAPSAQYCMAECDQIDACVAITFSQNQCLLYSSVTGTIPAYGSAALYRSSRAVAITSTVTFQTCAHTAAYTYTQYTTVDVTTTMTCASPPQCTTSAAAYFY